MCIMLLNKRCDGVGEENLEHLRVVVTGGAGFLGSQVVEKLKSRGCSEIFVPRSAEYDLTKAENVIRLYEKLKPDIVIHLAAVVGGIGANMQNPGKYFYDNLMMGTQLIEYGRIYGVRKFVAIGTVCSYPKYCEVPFSEKSLWDGYPEETNAPYGLAKKMMLVQGQAYRKQYGFKVIYLMPANLYGPGDNFSPETSHVIPALIRKCLEAKEQGLATVNVWGDGSASREFLYVKDAAEGIVSATERYEGVQPVNLGTGQEVSIKDLVAMIIRLTGFSGTISWDAAKPNGQPRRCLDTGEAHRQFGFVAATPLEAGLVKTIQWYRENNLKE
ncbi:MAG: nucleoside-diphosphate-sugar epimerase [Firmicutes bacterium]|nr:nucleoside-diphosphate-sugar epimerase [Bacillota bacterium]